MSVILKHNDCIVIHHELMVVFIVSVVNWISYHYKSRFGPATWQNTCGIKQMCCKIKLPTKIKRTPFVLKESLKTWYFTHSCVIVHDVAMDALASSFTILASEDHFPIICIFCFTPIYCTWKLIACEPCESIVVFMGRLNKQPVGLILWARQTF